MGIMTVSAVGILEGKGQRNPFTLALNTMTILAKTIYIFLYQPFLLGDMGLVTRKALFLPEGWYGIGKGELLFYALMAVQA